MAVGGGGGVLVHAVIGPSRNFTTNSSIAGVACPPTHPATHRWPHKLAIYPSDQHIASTAAGKTDWWVQILEYGVQLRWCCCRLVVCWTPTE